MTIFASASSKAELTKKSLSGVFKTAGSRMRATCLSGMDSCRNSDGAILPAPVLEKRKKKYGIADRTDILTIADLIDFDEGRSSNMSKTL